MSSNTHLLTVYTPKIHRVGNQVTLRRQKFIVVSQDTENPTNDGIRLMYKTELQLKSQLS